MTVAKPTIRELAVEGLVGLLEQIDATLPANDPYGEQFSHQSVYREPPKSIAAGRRAVGVVTEVAETKTELNFGVVECQLTAYVETHVLRQKSENMSMLVNAFLGIVERAIRANRYMDIGQWAAVGGTHVVDTLILGNEVALEGGPYEPYASAVTKLVIRYRHSTDDPRV
jgi:hypothetical protein